MDLEYINQHLFKQKIKFFKFHLKKQISSCRCFLQNIRNILGFHSVPLVTAYSDGSNTALASVIKEKGQNFVCYRKFLEKV